MGHYETHLYSIRQSSMTLLAWAIVMNQCSFRHSSRNFPLKDSMYAFSQVINCIGSGHDGNLV